MAKSLPTPFKPSPYDAFMVATWLCWRKASRVLNLHFQDTGLDEQNLTSNLNVKSQGEVF